MLFQSVQLPLPKLPTMTTQLAKAFNAIPQDKGPSGLWHFDLRYNPLEPNPHHILVCVQVHGNAIHVERLPVGLPSDKSGIEYFPESAVEAAPEIALAIVHIFVNKLNTPGSADSQGPAMLIPSKLTMRDRDLPLYVGRELKNLGILPTSLRNITISSPHVNERATVRLHPVFNKMKKQAGYKGANAALIPTPESIGLWNFKLDPPFIDNSPGLFKEHMEYVRLKLNTAPPLVRQDQINMRSELSDTMEMLDEEPEEVVREDADDGDPYSAFDYGMRLYVGLGCKRNRTLARYYVVKAAISPDAPDGLKAAAHSFLLDWLVHSSKDDFRKRYLYAATHHANMATVLCRTAPPPGVPATLPSSPTVLSFMRDVFERQVSEAPDLRLFCKDGIRAAEERLKQVEFGQEKLQAKKLKAPLKYRCAAVGCGVEADKGKMLAQCKRIFMSSSQPPSDVLYSFQRCGKM